jgi:hypothetical protein
LAAASPENFITAFLRALLYLHSTALMGCSELFVRFLLKLEGEKSAGLRQLSVQHAYGGEM